jgi:NitT/TauT family transport system substrate-binding protein
VQISGFVVSRKWAQANPNTLKAYARAIARAVDYLTANEKEAIVLQSEFTKTKPEVIMAGPAAWTNELSIENLETQMNLMVKHGLLQHPLDVRDLIWKP